MKNIIIADVKSVNSNGKSPGHYFTVAKNYLDLFKGLCDVKVIGGPVYKSAFSEADILKYDTKPDEPTVIQKKHIISNCFETFKIAKDDLLILQSNAVITVYVALFFSRRRNNIYMIQYNQLSINSWMKRLLFGCVKKKICGILCPTDEIGKAYGLPYCVIPDYCVTEDNIKRLPDKVQPKHYDFSMVGLITEDKGTVDAVSRLAGTNMKVIVAGRPDTQAIKDKLEKISSSCENIKLELGYISDERYDSIIRDSHYCVLNYTDAYSDHSSGVVFDVLYRGTPILGRMCESLRFVAENNLGVIYKSIDKVDFEDIIDISKEAEYLSNIRLYLKNELSVSNKILSFLNDNSWY